MAMHIHQLEQGSPEWLAYRKTKRPASYAAVAAGCSPFMTRLQLLDAYATGVWPEPSEIQQKIFDAGHRVERLLRPRVEDFLGMALYPVVGDRVVNGVDLSASMDGFFEDESGNHECKSLNEDLRSALPHRGWAGVEKNDARQLPAFYRYQLEQQCLVAGIERVLFGAAEFADDETLLDERYCWYESDPDLAAEIVAHWKQFNADLITHTPIPRVAKVKAEAVEALPALTSRVDGTLTVTHNFKAFGEQLDRYLATLPMKPATDQEFANLEDAIKRLKSAEEALDEEERRALASLEPINAMRTEKETLQSRARTKRLAFKKLVDDEKASIRKRIQDEHQAAFDVWVRQQNELLGMQILTMATIDNAPIAQCMSSKKSVQGWIEGANTGLANGKAAAMKVIDTIRTNQAAYAKLVTDDAHKPLFADLEKQLVKDPEAFAIICGQRISDFKRREEERLEGERARIRAEEQAAAEAKARREQQERNAAALQEIQGIQQQVAIATLGRAGVRKGGTIECIRETLAETEAWEIDPERFGALAGSAQAAKDKAIAEIRQLLADAETPKAAAPAPAPEHLTRVVHGDQVYGPGGPGGMGYEIAPRGLVAVGARGVLRPDAIVDLRPATPTGKPTLALGTICTRLGFNVTSSFLESLGFKATVERNARLYHVEDYPRICTALIGHISRQRDTPLQEAA